MGKKSRFNLHKIQFLISLRYIKSFEKTLVRLLNYDTDEKLSAYISDNAFKKYFSI